MRVRIEFDKTEVMQYTSHLDLYRAWERIFRRAKLPLAFSQGYKPHPKINIAAALPLGHTSAHDFLDTWFHKSLDIAFIYDRLINSTTPGILIRQVVEIDPLLPALQKTLFAAEYTITFSQILGNIADSTYRLLQSTNLIRMKKEKSYDLRPQILSLIEIEPDTNNKPQLRTILSHTESMVGRPEELILELGEKPENTHVHRERLLFLDNIESS